MDSRRLVVWISAEILGFKGFAIAFDLFNCTALNWVQLHRSLPLEPCKQPNGRIDAAVNHVLSVLAGLALGSQA